MHTSDKNPEEARALASQFGTTVRRLRSATGIAQEEFAYRCGLHRTTMSLIERGKHVVTLLTAKHIAEALGLSLADLMRELGRPDEA